MVYLIIIITLASLLMLLGCGTGDKGAVSRFTPSDIVSSGSETAGGGTGGGGATGACVITGGCYQGIDQTTCGYISGAFHVGQACATYGYSSCSAAGPYTVCF